MAHNEIMLLIPVLMIIRIPFAYTKLQLTHKRIDKYIHTHTATNKHITKMSLIIR